MGSDKRHFPLYVLCALLLFGCEIQTGDPAAGFGWAWAIVEAESGFTLDCDEVGLDFARIIVVDNDNETHEFSWQCEPGKGTTDGWNMATGQATYTAQVGAYDPVAGTDRVVAEFSRTYDFQAGSVDNDLGDALFEVTAGWDPTANTEDASVAWDWQVRETPSDPYEWFTQGDCDALDIDYARLWIYSEFHDEWWSDPLSSTFSCVPEFGVVPPDQPPLWTGLYLDDFLQEGRYSFEIGYYRQASGSQPGDMLMATDVSGESSESTLVQIDNDAPPTGYSHLSTTLFTKDAFTSQERGFLKIELIWLDKAGDVIADEGRGDCSSQVTAMGYSLVRDDGWIASERPLQDGLECRTSLVFEGVLASHSYDLVVWGDSEYDGILWDNNRCSGFVPVAAESASELDYQSCEIVHVGAE